MFTLKKYIITFSLILIYTINIYSQEKINTIVNTVKERILVSGYAQAGYDHSTEGEGENEFLLRRATLTVIGKITPQWTTCFQYSFTQKGDILNCYTEYSFMPELTVRMGQYLTPFTLDNQISPAAIELIRTQSTGTKYYTGCDRSDFAYGAQGGRDIGIMVLGSLFKNKLDYAFSVQNGQGINTKDKNKQKDIAGKLDFHILDSWIVTGSFIKGKGHAIADSRYNDIKMDEDYRRNRWSVGSALEFKKVNARVEYMEGKDKNTRSQGMYGLVCCEILPKLELIGSVDFLNRNKETKDKQVMYIGGIQYWFYPKCRLAAQYTYQKEKLRGNAQVLQAQIQVSF